MLPIMGMLLEVCWPVGAPAYAASTGQLSWVFRVCTKRNTQYSDNPEPHGGMEDSGARQADHRRQSTPRRFFQAQVPTQAFGGLPGDGHAQADAT